MSLLQSIVTEVLKNTVQSPPQAQQVPPNPQQGGLGGLLSGLTGGQSNATSASLGGLLGRGNVKSAGMNKSTLLLALLPIVLTFIQKNGGLSGVLSKFSNNGLQNKVQSWVNVDTNNDGIDADDIARLFDHQDIENICQKTGASRLEVYQGIAELLPKVMDDLTPQGDLSKEKEANDEIAELLANLKSCSVV